MANTLQIGRVGLDVAFENAVVGFQELSNNEEGRQVTLSGLVKTATLADTKALRTELSALPGQLVPILWSFDATFDGFYVVTEATLDASAQSGSYTAGGLFGFNISATLLGSEANLEFQSKLIGTVLSNDKGVTDPESAPFIATPVGAYAWEQGTESPGTLTRSSADGNVTVFRDVLRTTYPTWGVAVADYYKGGASFTSATYLRQSTHTPNSPTDWELANGLIRVSPNATNGRIDVEHYDGSIWDTAVVWEIDVGGAEVGTWDALGVIKNRPDSASIRLVRADSPTGRHTLDLSLRRGSRYVSGLLSTSTSATLKVALNGGGAATAITPSGASSAVAVQRSSTVNGNRVVVGTANATPNTGDTSVSETSTTSMEFFIGSEVNYTASAGDTAADLCLQYLGHISETVTAVRR